MPGKKLDVITLKVDRSLAEAMEGVSNRSGFIRDAILAALENICPLCMGTGILSPRQKQHWASFARDHRMRQCPDCHERHLTCRHDKARPRRRRDGAHGKTPETKKSKKP
jgi:hypothetical protein